MDKKIDKFAATLHHNLMHEIHKSLRQIKLTDSNYEKYLDTTLAIIIGVLCDYITRSIDPSDHATAIDYSAKMMKKAMEAMIESKKRKLND